MAQAPMHSFSDQDSPDLASILSSADAVATITPRLADGSIDPNAILGFPGTPLTVALRNANLPLARLLISHGADPRAFNLDEPPLVVAVQHCPSEFVNELLETHWKINTAAPTGEESELLNKALYAAAGLCRAAVINVLLSHGAQVNSEPYAPADQSAKGPAMNPHLNYQEQTRWGTGTALHVVARATPPDRALWDKLKGRKSLWSSDDQLEAAKVLLKGGADLHSKDTMGRTAVEVAKLANSGKAVLEALGGH